MWSFRRSVCASSPYLQPGPEAQPPVATITATATLPPRSVVGTLRQQLSRDDLVMRGALLALGLWLVLTVLLPLWALLSKSFQAADGSFVGLANFGAYF